MPSPRTGHKARGESGWVKRAQPLDSTVLSVCHGEGEAGDSISIHSGMPDFWELHWSSTICMLLFWKSGIPKWILYGQQLNLCWSLVNQCGGVGGSRMMVYGWCRRPGLSPVQLQQHLLPHHNIQLGIIPLLLELDAASFWVQSLLGDSYSQVLVDGQAIACKHPWQPWSDLCQPLEPLHSSSGEIPYVPSRN